jgi:hypothetical protein
VKEVDPHFTKQAEKVLTDGVCQKTDGNCSEGQGRKRVLMVKFMQQGTIIASEKYCQTPNNLRRAGHSEQKAWNADIRVVFFHDSDSYSNRIIAESFNWELFDHST